MFDTTGKVTSVSNATRCRSKYHVEGNVSRIRPREISSDGNISDKDELSEEQHPPMAKSASVLSKEIMKHLK